MKKKIKGESHETSRGLVFPTKEKYSDREETSHCRNSEALVSPSLPPAAGLRRGWTDPPGGGADLAAGE